MPLHIATYFIVPCLTQAFILFTCEYPTSPFLLFSLSHVPCLPNFGHIHPVYRDRSFITMSEAPLLYHRRSCFTAVDKAESNFHSIGLAIHP